MNYQEYDWNFNTNSVPIGTPSKDDPWQSNFGTCIGNMCCSEGLVYDTDINQCVSGTNAKQSTPEIPTSLTNLTQPSPSTNQTLSTSPKKTVPAINKESFITSILTKLQPGNYKISYDLKEPKSFND